MKSKSKYNSHLEWKKAKPHEHDMARRNGHLISICEKLSWDLPRKNKGKHKPANYWTKKRCIEDANEYDDRINWKNKSGSAYNKAVKNGWVDDICESRGWVKPNKYIQIDWTKELCLEVSNKYDQIYKWKKFDNQSYTFAKNNDWFDECTTHMKLRKPAGFWQIKGNVFADAKNFNFKVEWGKASVAAAKSARDNGWYYECTKHMVHQQHPVGYWNKERCLVEAKKWDGPNSWHINGKGSYRAARDNDWFDECTKHMNND